MNILTPAASVVSQDPNLSTQPTPLLLGGQPLNMQTAVDAQELILAAATDDQDIPYPLGVTTAGFIAIYAAGASDLVVGYGAEDLALPKGQVMMFYNVPSGKVQVSSVLGGKILFVVGA